MFRSCINSYQMNPANYREALIETNEDEAEGADILLVDVAFYINLIANPECHLLLF